MSKTLYITVGFPQSGYEAVVNMHKTSQLDACTIVPFVCQNIEHHTHSEYKAFIKALQEALSYYDNVYAVAPNITTSFRKTLLTLAKNAGADVEALLCVKPVMRCVLDDVTSNSPVGADAILNLMQKFEIPVEEEGFSAIRVFEPLTYHRPDVKFLEKLKKKMEQCYQHNAYHDHYVADHCDQTSTLFFQNYPHYGAEYQFAASFHDVGKIFTRTVDDDGTTHFYNHENVGAYFFLSHLRDLEECTGMNRNRLLDAIALINYHMLPRSWTSQKVKTKWEDRLGVDRIKLIEDFNRCDKSRELEQNTAMHM